jgi:hypothetical protein
MRPILASALIAVLAVGSYTNAAEPAGDTTFTPLIKCVQREAIALAVYADLTLSDIGHLAPLRCSADFNANTRGDARSLEASRMFTLMGEIAINASFHARHPEADK